MEPVPMSKSTTMRLEWAPSTKQCLPSLIHTQQQMQAMGVPIMRNPVFLLRAKWVDVGIML